jgi:hypothetical protein
MDLCYVKLKLSFGILSELLHGPLLNFSCDPMYEHIAGALLFYVKLCLHIWDILGKCC